MTQAIFIIVGVVVMLPLAYYPASKAVGGPLGRLLGRKGMQHSGVRFLILLAAMGAVFTAALLIPDGEMKAGWETVLYWLSVPLLLLTLLASARLQGKPQESTVNAETDGADETTPVKRKNLLDSAEKWEAGSLAIALAMVTSAMGLGLGWPY